MLVNKPMLLISMDSAICMVIKSHFGSTQYCGEVGLSFGLGLRPYHCELVRNEKGLPYALKVSSK